MSAERVAERIRALSGGRLQITVHAAGEVVPAFEVLDAVGSGVAEMGHTAAFYWQGKQPAAAFYTTVPFGLTPNEHVAWVDAGGGQALWDELYAPFGVKPFMGGNTGVCMGGWFRREIKSLDDVRGLEDPLARARRRSLSPARRDPADHLAGRDSHQPAIGPDRRRGIRRARLRHRARALSRGAVLLRAGLQQAERHRRMHRLAQGLGARSMPSSRRSSRMPARPRRAFALAEMERLNAEALAALTGQHGVKLRTFPAEPDRRSRASRRTTCSPNSPRQRAVARKVHDSYVAFRERTAAWSRISIKAVLDAREG